MDWPSGVPLPGGLTHIFGPALSSFNQKGILSFGSTVTVFKTRNAALLSAAPQDLGPLSSTRLEPDKSESSCFMCTTSSHPDTLLSKLDSNE